MFIYIINRYLVLIVTFHGSFILNNSTSWSSTSWSSNLVIKINNVGMRIIIRCILKENILVKRPIIIYWCEWGVGQFSSNYLNYTLSKQELCNTCFFLFPCTGHIQCIPPTPLMCINYTSKLIPSYVHMPTGQYFTVFSLCNSNMYYLVSMVHSFTKAKLVSHIYTKNSHYHILNDNLINGSPLLFEYYRA